MWRWICLRRWWPASSWTGSFRVWRAKCVSNTFSSFTPQPPPSSLSAKATKLRFSIVFICSLVYLFIFRASSSLLRGGPRLAVPESQCTTASAAVGGAAVWMSAGRCRPSTPDFSHRPFPNLTQPVPSLPRAFHSFSSRLLVGKEESWGQVAAKKLCK